MSDTLVVAVEIRGKSTEEGTCIKPPRKVGWYYTPWHVSTNCKAVHCRRVTLFQSLAKAWKLLLQCAHDITWNSRLLMIEITCSPKGRNRRGEGADRFSHAHLKTATWQTKERETFKHRHPKNSTNAMSNECYKAKITERIVIKWVNHRGGEPCNPHMAKCTLIFRLWSVSLTRFPFRRTVSGTMIRQA